MATPTIAQAPIRYNEIPKDSVLLTRIKTLGPTEHVKYRVFGSYNPRKPGKISGRTTVLPSSDVITDPKTGDVYDIAFIQGMGPGGVPNFGEIIFDDSSYFTITLRGGSATDRRIYQYIELCNFLKDNPSRDQNKSVLIERVDETEDFKYKRDGRKRVQAALNAVEAMSDNEIINFIRANRMPDSGTNESRRAAVEDFAEKNSEKFAQMPSVDYTALYDTVDAAKKAKIIVWNNVTRDWTRFSGELILQVKKGFNVSQKDELAQYLMSKAGKADLDWIKVEINKV